MSTFLVMLKLSFGASFVGHISDFNIFSRVMDEQEQEQWTTCQSSAKGDIFSLDKETISKLTINDTNDDPRSFLDISVIDKSDLCMEKEDKPYIIELFTAGDISNFDAELMCQHLNGDFLMLPQTEYELMLLRESMLDYQIRANITFDVWPGAAGPCSQR